MKRLVQVVFYPALVLGALAVYFKMVGDAAPARISALTLAIGVGAIAIIHLCERLLPYRPEWNLPQGDRSSNFFLTNVALPVAAKFVELGLGVFMATFVSQGIHERLHLFWPGHWGLPAQFVFAVLVCEFSIYWIHRLGHRTAYLWRFHAIHHSVRRLYWDNSGRFHPIDAALNLVVYLAPLALLGAPPVIVGGFLVLNVVTGLLEHANVDFKAGPLNYVFNTAELHRWHHAADPELSSKNFGKALAVWDLAFGTWFRPAGRSVGELGVTTERIPEDFWGQLLHPWMGSRG